MIFITRIGIPVYVGKARIIGPILQGIKLRLTLVHSCVSIVVWQVRAELKFY